MQTSVSISQIMKEKEVFHDVLPGIIDNLQASSKISQLPELGSWVRKVCNNFCFDTMKPVSVIGISIELRFFISYRGFLVERSL